MQQQPKEEINVEEQKINYDDYDKEVSITAASIINDLNMLPDLKYQKSELMQFLKGLESNALKL